MVRRTPLLCELDSVWVTEYVLEKGSEGCSSEKWRCFWVMGDGLLAFALMSGGSVVSGIAVI